MRCAVLGDPIAHSLSPVLHRAAYAAPGSTGATTPSGRGRAARFLAGLDGSWRGLSLTMPLKREALPLAARSPTAPGSPGRPTRWSWSTATVHADNTDLPGAAAALRERYDGPVTVGHRPRRRRDGRVGRAWRCATSGARSLLLLVRDPARADRDGGRDRAAPGRPARARSGSLSDGRSRGERAWSPPSRPRPRTPPWWPGARTSPVVFEVRLRPVADPARRCGGRTGCWSAGSTCWCTRPRSSSRSFTGLPAPLERDARRRPGAGRALRTARR